MLAPGATHAAGAFGPETFVIASGQVPFFERSFSVVDTASAYRLRVRNGVGGHPRVLAAALLLNGNLVVTPLQLNFFVQQFERTVHLKRNNKLALLLVAPPGAAVSVEIFAAGSGDTDPPTIAAIPEPPANAAGWNNQDVVVRFECADSGSGVASCPGPVTVSAEGAGQVVTRTATDNAGNSASASVTLNIDKTPPTVTATSSPPPNAGGWNRTDVVVSFACTDALSGVSTCPPDATVTTEGAGQVVSGASTDRAGNSATASVTLKVDKTPPVIGATSDPPPNAAAWNNTDLTVTFTCAGNEGGAPCPEQVVLTTEGAGQIVSGTVADQADNSASASVTLNIDKTPPSLVASLSPAPNQAGWNNTDVTVSFDAQDALSGVASAPTPVTLTTEGPTQAVDGTAVDRADNVATATAFVNIDKTAPVVVLTAPVDGVVRRVPRVEVAGTATEANGLAAVSVNGVNAGTSANFQVEVPLTQEGAQTLTATARDIADNAGSADVTVVYSAPPVVKITSPANLAAFGTTPITVSGTVDDTAATIRVGIADAPAVVTGNTWTAEGVALREGGNVVTAVATDAQGNSATDSVTLILDTTAPRVFIDSPSDGTTTRATTVAVAGHVQDVVMGTVNSGQAQVRVNGVPAAVSNRTFLAPNVTLAPGLNTITATVMDAVGNSDTQTISVVLDATEGARVSVVSGDGQTAGIGETLPQPLVVAVTDVGGSPLVDRTVVFSVVENNGALSVAGGAPARNVVATTDGAGHAQTALRLGSRAGAGNNRVEATSPGIAGAAVFTASALAHPPAKINLDSGNNQKGLVGQPLPRPFVAVVTDEGHNRLTGVPVTFHVVEGGGDFNGESLVTVASDSDGRAVAVLRLGSSPGVENNVVEASVPGLDTLPTTFTASGMEPGDPAQTRISGVVLDNTGQPVPGVTLRLRGTAHASTADAQGQFLLSGVPVGDVHLFADGSTAQRSGTWPDLEYEMVTVAGANNTLGMPIYLLPLNTGSGIFVDETHGGTVTLPDFPGFSLTVAPNSATFPDGTRHGTVTVTVVHLDKVPMVPNFGQQPRFIVTIQPPGVRFDPPAQVTHPNVDGLAPGEKTELYSFDHDAGSFVATGTATVSADGSVLRSDPGTGVVKGGWHCGGDPAAAGTIADCDECEICNGVACVPDASQNGHRCQGDDCKECRSGSCLARQVRITAPNAGSRHNITAVPAMPAITATATPTVPTEYEWTLRITDTRGTLNCHLTCTETTGATWTPNFATCTGNAASNILGGDATLTVRACTTSDTRMFLVRGLNPTRAQVQGRIGNDQTARKIACFESGPCGGQQQFNSSGLPCSGPTGDFGIFQLTRLAAPPVSCESLWDWTANVRDGLSTLASKRNAASNHHVNERQRVNAQRASAGLPPCAAGMPPALSTDPSFAGDQNPNDGISEHERESARRFNSGREHQWQITNQTTCAGFWASAPVGTTNPGYVNDVLAANCP